MKKDKLIALLQELEGNPDVYFWNGFVSDYMDVLPKIDTYDMVKEQYSFTLNGVIGEYLKGTNQTEVSPEVYEQLEEKARSIHSRKQWDFPNPFVEDEEDFKHWYGSNKKKVAILNTKLRGKLDFSRGKGKLEY